MTRPLSEPSAAQPAAIAIAGLGKWYGAFHALRRIELTVAPGEHVVLCGEDGSGKSTLIRCINRLEAFQAGTVLIGGAPLPHGGPALTLARQRIGMVFNSANLFAHMTVLGNCTWALHRARGMNAAQAEALALAALERVHMAADAGRHPAELSGGQQQRVAIARALAMDPGVMLFDEPTTALDPAMAAEVLAVMTEIAASGMTMICATGEIGFARQAADRVVFMDGGRIIEMATPERFVTNPSSAGAKAFLAQRL